MVFTTQGGCDKHSEALLSQIADLVARTESREPGVVKAELLQLISMSIMKSVANAVIRRSSGARSGGSEQVPMAIELATLDETLEDDG